MRIAELILAGLWCLAAGAVRAEDGERRPLVGVWYTENWGGGALPNAEADLAEIRRRLAPDFVALATFAFQARADSSDPHRSPEKTLSDENIALLAAAAHRQGMHVLLLAGLRVDDGSYSGFIAPLDVAAWHAAWKEIAVHYAELSERLHIETLLIGAEMDSMAAYSDYWLPIIEAVRQRYRGELSYSANHWGDALGFAKVLEMRQWSRYDTIGVAAYFSLTDALHPSEEELRFGWDVAFHNQPVRAQLEILAARYQKPIAFWEIGYRSIAKNARMPWRFADHGEPSEPDQAAAFSALFAVFGERPWFRGLGIYGLKRGLKKTDNGFDILGKAAEGAVNGWPRASLPAAVVVGKPGAETRP